MKILNQGQLNLYVATCPECNCSFTFDNSEIHRKYEEERYYDSEKRETKYYIKEKMESIQCPTCNLRFILRERR